MRPLGFLLIFLLTQSAEAARWVATWSASPAAQMPAEADLRAAKMYFENQTLREIVHVSLGGNTIRVRLSNVYGKVALGINAAHVALRDRAADGVPGTDRELLFSGQAAISIPPNAVMLSDPISLKVPAGGDLLVSLFLKNPTIGAGIQYVANATSYIGAENCVGAVKFQSTTRVGSWAFLAGVDVMTPDSGGTIIAFGDSITAGSHSTPDANHRWPDYLAERMRTAGMADLAVVNAGIGGNRILRDAAKDLFTRVGANALARFDRDVLGQPGARFVIVLEGINDLGQPGSATAPILEAATAQDVIAGLRQMAERAHEVGVKFIGATITPFAGTISPGYYSLEKDAQRAIVNTWIRTTEVFDAYIDFDQALRDKSHFERLLPAYDSGDHLHPSDAGYKAMADAIDLGLFRARQKLRK